MDKALAAIGNELGRFICLDDSLLKGSDRKMARILVELDVHAGLPETLDIIWRGRTVTQCLDYLGIPFRCTSCHRTGHLWRDCTGEPKEEESKASYLRKLSQEDSPGVDSFLWRLMDLWTLVTGQSSPLDTLTGKLKQHCPTFYYTLTSWERNFWTHLLSRGWGP
jgi:hypothetical protein